MNNQNKKVFRDRILSIMLIIIIGINTSGIMASGQTQESNEPQDSNNSEITPTEKGIRENIISLPFFEESERLTNLKSEPNSHISTSQDPNPIREDITASPPQSSDGEYVAVLEDDLPWGYTATYDILDAEGIPYVIINSYLFGTADLSAYSKVVVSSDQSQEFNDAIVANRNWLEDYVSNGGTLEFHAATNAAWIGTLPGGFTYISHTSELIGINYTGHNILIDPNVITDEELDGWSSSVHGYLENVGDAVEILFTEAEGYTVLAESTFGAGNIIISTQTLEYAYGNDHSLFLENVLLYYLLPLGDRHDLRVKIIGEDSYYLGESTTIEMQVSNIGTFNESNIDVFLDFDGTEIAQTMILLLEPNQTYTLSYEWLAQPSGIHTFLGSVPTVVDENITANNVDELLVQVLNVKNYTMESVEFNWFDAQGNGFNLGLAGDDLSASVSLPFEFPFYDAIFDQIYISSNGWLSFTNTNPYDYSCPGFPTDESEFTYAMAPFWKDLQADDNIYVWATTDFVVIEYADYNYLGGASIGSFEVILFSTGEIIFQYASINSDSGAIVGLNYGLENSIYSLYSEGLSGVSNFALEFRYIIEHDVSVSVSTPELPIIGNLYNISATMVNQGINIESEIDFVIYLDGVPVVFAANSTLLVGESSTLIYEWTAPSYGIFNFTAQASPTINETNLGNNEFTRIVSILHDLDVSLTLPPYAIIDTTYMVNATVVNLGMNLEVNITLDFYLDGLLVDTVFIPLLGGEDSFILSYSWTPTAFASYVFSADATLEISDPYIGVYEDSQIIIVANNQINPTLGDIFQFEERFGLRRVPYSVGFEVTAFPSPDRCEFTMTMWDPYDNEYFDEMILVVNPLTRRMEGEFDELFPYWINTEGLAVGSFFDFYELGDQEGEVIGFTTYNYYDQVLTLIEVSMDGMVIYYEQISGILAVIGDVEIEEDEHYDLVFTNIESAIAPFHNVRGVICEPDEDNSHPLEDVEIFIQNTGTYSETTTFDLTYNGDLVWSSTLTLLPGEFEFFMYPVDAIPTDFVGLVLTVDQVGGETYIVDNYDATPSSYYGEIEFNVYDSDSNVIEGAWIFLYDEVDVEIYAGQTDSNGELNVIMLDAGTYRIGVTADGFEAHSESISLGSGEIKNMEIYLSPLSDDPSDPNNPFGNIPGYSLSMLLGILGFTAFGLAFSLKKRKLT